MQRWSGPDDGQDVGGGAVDAGPTAGSADAEVVDVSDLAGFVRRHSGSWFTTAHLLTGDRTAAEDLLQETLAGLVGRWYRVEAADNPVAYVRRAVVNRFVSGTRRADRREVPVAEPPAPSTPGRDPGDAVVAALTVWPLLQQLPDRYRAALVLRYFHDHTDVEIAEALGCRRGTARSLVSRGLALLRTALGETGTGAGTTTSTARGRENLR